MTKISEKDERQCRLCGFRWHAEHGEPCILGTLPVCESCHDNFYGEFDKADNDFNPAGHIINEQQIQIWTFEQAVTHKQIIIGLKGIHGVNVMFIATPSMESLARRCK